MWPEDLSNPNPAPEHPEGELAAFALNALDDAEFQAVFHHVIKCLHCQEVLLGFQDTAARLAAAAPASPLPPGLKSRTLARAVGRPAEPEPTLPPADARWSLRRLRRWLAPAAIGTLALLLFASAGVIVSQQRAISQLSAANAAAENRLAAMAASPPAGAPAAPTPIAPIVADALPTTASAASHTGASPTQTPAAPVARALNALGLTADDAVSDAAATVSETAIPLDPEQVDLVRQEVADVVEATVLSEQPETEKLPMISPMGTEPEAKGVLMVDPTGRQGVLMVSGMPADSYQIWLARGDKQTLVGRIVVNEDHGSGVKQLELDESVFEFREVALMPDERHGPTSPTGAKFLTARIIPGPPMPPHPANANR